MPMAATDPATATRPHSGALRLAALLAAGPLACACTVQLTAPYSTEIDREATALQSDFLKYAAGMQFVAGTPKGYYDQHNADYGDFEARLAVIRLRSESLSGGVSCNQALHLAKAARKPLAGQIEQSMADAGPLPAGSGASCVTILTGLAQRNLERLRSQHAVRCNPAAKPVLCTTLFAAPPIYDLLVPGPSEAPLVSAVAITLNELVSAERDLRPDGAQ